MTFEPNGSNNHQNWARIGKQDKKIPFAKNTAQAKLDLGEEREGHKGVLADEKKAKAKRIRNQCLLVYAGQLYYDVNTGIVLWTNHSGHFAPKVENRYLVNLPDNLFIPMGSQRIREKLEEHIINSPPTSPVGSPGTLKNMIKKIGRWKNPM